MRDRRRQKYGIVRGGRYGRRPSATAFTTSEFRLDREMVAVFAALESESGTVPSRAIQEIREGNQKPWRYLARRFREARLAGVEKDAAKAPLRVLELYIDELFSDTNERGRAA